jgi:hypothetical protein
VRTDSRQAVNSVPTVPATSATESGELKKPQPVMVERPAE